MRLENLAADDRRAHAPRLSATVTVTRPGPGGTVDRRRPPDRSPAPTTSTPTTASLDHAGAVGSDRDRRRRTSATDHHPHRRPPTSTLLHRPRHDRPAERRQRHVRSRRASPTSTPTSDTSVGATVTVTYTYVSDNRPPDAAHHPRRPAGLHRRPQPRSSPSPPSPAPPPSAGSPRPSSDRYVGALHEPLDPATSPGTDDGLYTFSVRATDAAGNVGHRRRRGPSPSTASPPSTRLDVRAAGPRPAARTPTWAFTIEPGATARCSLDGVRAGAVHLAVHRRPRHGRPTAPTPSRCVAVDAAGNAGPADRSTPTRSTARRPLAPTITAPPASPGNDPTPDLGDRAGGRRDDRDLLGRRRHRTPRAARPFTADLSAAADGPHTIAVRNADAAGNQSAAATSSTYDLDRGRARRPDHHRAHRRRPTSPRPTWGITRRAPAPPPSAGSTPAPGRRAPARSRPRSVRAATACTCSRCGPPTPPATAAPRRPPPTRLDTTRPRPPHDRHRPGRPEQQPHARSGPSPSTPTAPPTLLARRRPVGPVHVAAPGRPRRGAADGVAPAGGAGHRRPGQRRAAGGRARFVLDRTAPAAPVDHQRAELARRPAPPCRGPSPRPTGTTARCRIDMGPLFAVRRARVDGHLRRRRPAPLRRASPSTPPATAAPRRWPMYTLDRVAPVAPTITASPTSPDRVHDAPVDLHRRGRLRRRVRHRRLRRGCRARRPSSPTCRRAADGPHTFAVRSVDGAGQRRRAPQPATFVLDRTPPGAPVRHRCARPPTATTTPRRGPSSSTTGAAAGCRIDDGAVGAVRRRPSPPTSAPAATASTPSRCGPSTRSATWARRRSPPTSLDRVAAGGRHLHRRPAVARQRPDARSGPSPTSPARTAWCSLDGATAVVVRRRARRPTLLADGTPRGRRGRRRRGRQHAARPTTSTYELDTVAPASPRLTAPRTPDRDVHPEWGIEVEPGAVAECSFDDGERRRLRRRVHRRPRPASTAPTASSVFARDAAGQRVRAGRRAPTCSTRSRRRRPVLLHTPDRGRLDLALHHRGQRHRGVLGGRRPVDARARARCPAARPARPCASRSAPSTGPATAPPSPAPP